MADSTRVVFFTHDGLDKFYKKYHLQVRDQSLLGAVKKLGGQLFEFGGKGKVR